MVKFTLKQNKNISNTMGVNEENIYIKIVFYFSEFM